MGDTETAPFKLFSATTDQFMAECPNCERVFPVAMTTADRVEGGAFEVEGGLLCSCGHRATRVERQPEQVSEGSDAFINLFAWGVAAALVLGVGYLLFWLGSGIFGGQERAPDLTADVRVSGGQVHVTNNDSFDWTACTISLNSGIGGSWSQSVTRIPAGETASEGLMAFTRGRGERFNPLTHALEDVLVMCSTPNGRSAYAGRF